MRPIIAVVFGAALTASQAQATTLSGDLTVDNAFFAYLSTSPSTLGTPLTSGNSWPTTFSFTSGNLANETYYLNIEAINYGGPGAFIGTFTLSDTGFEFANGSQTLSTDTADWLGIFNSTNSAVSPQPWLMPTGGVYSEGANGVGPWGTASQISASAVWIWPNDVLSANGCQNLNGGFCTVDFSTPIFSTSATPLPAALPLFAGGLGLMGLISRRRKRNGAADIVAA
jgi:hypothetical protein